VVERIHTTHTHNHTREREKREKREKREEREERKERREREREKREEMFVGCGRRPNSLSESYLGCTSSWPRPNIASRYTHTHTHTRVTHTSRCYGYPSICEPLRDCSCDSSSCCHFWKEARVRRSMGFAEGGSWAAFLSIPLATLIASVVVFAWK